MESFKVKYIATCKEQSLLPNDAIMHVLRESNKLSKKSDGELVLHFSGCNLSLQDCQVLSKCFATDNNIEVYHFTDCLLNEDACKIILNALMFNKTIFVLDMKGNNLRSSGAELIGKLLKRSTSLRELYLEWNTLGMWDDGIRAIAEGLALNESLQVLDLSNNQIGHEGGEDIAAALKRNRFLRTLDMRWNNVGVLGGRAFLSALNHNKYIINLLLAGNNIPNDTMKAVTTAVQRNIDYHSIYEEHHTMTMTLKQEIDQLQLEKSMQVSTLVEQLEKEKILHDSLSETTRGRLEQMKIAIEDLKKENKKLREQNQNYVTQMSEKDNKAAEAESQMERFQKDTNSTINELRKHHAEQIDELREILRKEKLMKLGEQTEKENISDEMQKKIKDLKEKLEQQTSEVTRYSNNLKKLIIDHETAISDLQEKYDKETNELRSRIKIQENLLRENTAAFDNKKQMFEEELCRLKSSSLADKLKYEEQVVSQRGQWKQEDILKTKQYENRIDMLVSTKDELQSKISRLSIQVAELNAQVLNAQKEAETYKRQGEHQQQLLNQRDLEFRSETNKLKSEIDVEKRKCSDLLDRIQNVETKNQELKSQVRELISGKETEVNNLKSILSSKEDEIKRMRDEELRRVGLLESAFQTYISSTRSSYNNLLAFPLVTCLHQIITDHQILTNAVAAGTAGIMTKKPSHLTVQETNDSSILSKASITQLGYFRDPFLKLFASRVARRAPLIHRGYYIRAKAIDYSLTRFLECNKGVSTQIVSLGAGFDSSYFRLKDKSLLKSCTYIEIDFPDVVRRKQLIIKKHSELVDIIGNHTIDNNVFCGDDYRLLPCDLTNIKLLEKLLKICKTDFEKPTLFFSECVLTYVEYDQSKLLLSWLQKMFPNSVIIVYEQIQPNDAFGQVMLKHFCKIQSPLRRIFKLHNISEHKSFFRNLGYETAHGFDMNFFYYHYLSHVEKERMCSLELFDEYEEWHLKCSHYAIIAAFQGSCSSVGKVLFPWEQRVFLPTEKITVPLVAVGDIDFNSKRYGHSLASCSFNNSHFVSGGFGITITSSHEKLDTGLIFDCHTSNDTVSIKGVKPIKVHVKRMYHTSCFVDEDVLFIYGGRTSPKKLCGEYGFYKIVNEELKAMKTFSLENEIDGKSRPVGRWRHAMVKVDGKIYIHGGRSVNEVTFEDFWIYDIEKNEWINPASVELPGCHSHSMNLWKDNALVMYGGLTRTKQALNSFHVISLGDLKCTSTIFNPPLPPRYSHTCHLIKSNLLVVGGINPESSEPSGLLLISLAELSWKSISLPSSDPERPLMMHNHCSILLNESKVVIVGGGGNCFSFGTHFNHGLTVLDVADVLALKGIVTSS